MSQPRAILFDVDGVLLDSGAANVAFYQELFRQIGGVVPSQADLERNNHLSVEATLRKYYPDWPDAEVQKWMIQADTIDIGFSLLRPMPGVLATLPRLAETYQFGLVTNRTVAGIDELWQVVPYAKHFVAAAAYEYTAKHKPDPEPIHYVLQRLGLAPHEAVFVGDAKTDLQAGQAAGVDVIILGPESWPGAWATITDFSELPLVLARH